MDEGIKKIDDFLSRYEKIIISTHESPDADGLGAQIAFLELLKNIGKEAMIINSDPMPDNLEFIDIDREVNIFHEDMELPEDITSYAQIVLDTNDYDNIGRAYYTLKDLIQEVFIIDHHEGTKDKIKQNYIKAEASSASEIVYGIIQYYKQPFSFKAAQAIFTGMVFDTGSFKYPKTSSYTYQIAAHCLEMGVSPMKVHEQLYENNSLSSFELRSKILSTMESFHGGKMIAMKLTPHMLEETGASFSEGESSINLPLTVKGVVISLLVKHSGEGPVKVSMRTKGDFDVAEIAMENNGGGHKNAAGFKSQKSFEDTYSYAVSLMDRFFS